MPKAVSEARKESDFGHLASGEEQDFDLVDAGVPKLVLASTTAESDTDVSRLETRTLNRGVIGY